MGDDASFGALWAESHLQLSSDGLQRGMGERKSPRNRYLGLVIRHHLSGGAIHFFLEKKFCSSSFVLCDFLSTRCERLTDVRGE